MTAALRYWLDLTRALLLRPVPRTEAELRAWTLAQVVLLWDRVCTASGDTFAAYVQRSGVRLPVGWLRHRSVAAAALYAWPLLAILLVRKLEGERSGHYRRALLRPDLYAAFPGMPFSAEVVQKRRADIFVAVFNAWHFAQTRSPSYTLEDKSDFARLAREAGLPVVPELSLEEASTSPGPFIVKDPSLDQGLGVRRVASVAELAALPDRERLLLQRCLENHPELLAILPPDPPLCTLRLTTTWQGDSAVCHIAYFRIGDAGAHLDNVSRGGLFVEADLETGVLLPGLTHAMLHGKEPPGHVLRAAGAAQDFAGRTLPQFEAAKALCRRAHAALAPDLLSVGWDVALGVEGPVLVEANVFAGSFEVRQLADSYGLTTRELLRRLGSDPG